MQRVLNYIAIVLLVLAVVLFITKPTEEQYLDRVVADYANIHPGMILTANDLVSMGNTHYTDNVFFSAYRYEFGQISVSYWGVLGYVYYKGYQYETEEQQPNGISV